MSYFATKYKYQASLLIQLLIEVSYDLNDIRMSNIFANILEIAKQLAGLNVPHH